MADKRRIVVTGIGMVSPLGHTREQTWQALLAGESGIDHIQGFDATGFATQIAAEVKGLNIAERLPYPKLRQQTVPFIDFALIAAEEALQDAGLRPTVETAQHWGMVAGSGMMTSPYEYWCQFQQAFAPTGELDRDKLGQDRDNFCLVNDFAKTQPNSGLALMLKQFNIRGYANSVHTACASGGQALGLALQTMRRGECDYMLAGGFDSMINPIGLASFCLLGAVSPDNDDPMRASRPFDLTRNGFVLGEGAAFLVLESLEHATARGAHIYAELAGSGDSLSSYRITDSPPDGDGPRQAIEQALTNADIKPEDVDYINAHGTSTKMNDLSEVNAVKAAFGKHAYQLAMSSTKSQTGHLIAAAGALEAGFCALSLDRAMLPMTKNLQTADPECDLDFIQDGPRPQTINVAMTNSFGFGGSNSSLVFKRVEGQR